jgi:hypothetical protein
VPYAGTYERPHRGDAYADDPKALGVVLRLAALLGALLLPAALTGCGDACSAALDKLASCGAAAGDGGSNVSTQTCDSCYLCQSQCINNATCTEILYPGGADSLLTKCDNACNETDCLGQ